MTNVKIVRVHYKFPYLWNKVCCSNFRGVGFTVFFQTFKGLRTWETSRGLGLPWFHVGVPRHRIIIKWYSLGRPLHSTLGSILVAFLTLPNIDDYDITDHGI